jgi:DNA replication protein DnaC
VKVTEGKIPGSREIMDFRMKQVNGTCKCGNNYSGTIPAFAEMTMCDTCALEFQRQKDIERFRSCLRESCDSCGIPKKYREWDADKAKAVGSDKLLDWLRGHGTNSVWIGGTNGIGKTHTVLYRAFELLSNYNIHPYCVRASAWLRTVVTSRSKDKSDAEKQYKRAIECKLLVLDDFGKERLTEPRAEFLYDIIDERDRRDGSLWITTNFGGAELKDRLNCAGDGGHEYGHAILKRLARMMTKERIWK